MPMPPEFAKEYRSPFEAQPATPAYRPGAAPDTAYNQLLEKLTPEVEEAFRNIQPQRLRETVRSLRELDEPLRRQEQLRLRRSVRTTRDFIRTSNKLIATAKREGRPDLAEKMKQARQKALRGEASPMETLKAGGEMLFRALDYPHKKLVRSWTTPKREGDKPDKDVGAQEWVKRVREEADKGEFFPKLITGLAEIPGWAFGLPVGGAVAGAGVLADLVSGRDPSWENVKQTVKETQKDVADMAILIGTDPVSMFSMGTFGSAKNAMGATLRGTAKSLGKQKATDLAKSVGKIAAEKAGTPKVFDDVLAAFTDAGLSADDAMKIFGKEGEFFGRSQLRIHAPMISKLGVDLPQLTGKEFALGKAAQKGYHYAKKPLEAATGSQLRELYDPTRMLTRQVRRGAKGGAAIMERQFLDRYEEIGKRGPATAERREWIVKNVIDPHAPPGLDKINRDALFTKSGKMRRLDKTDPTKLDDKLLTLRDELIDELGDLKQIEDLPMRRAERKSLIDRYKTLTREAMKDDTLLRQLAPAERRWVQDLDALFGDIHASAVKSGYLKQNRIAWNQWTGRYFPRDFSRQWGLLDDLPATKMGRLTDPGKARSRQGAGLELGMRPQHLQTKIDDVAAAMQAEGRSAEEIATATQALRERMGVLEKIKGVADPHRAVPNYIQRAARGSGAAELEKSMLNAFGVPAGSKSVTGWAGDYTAIGKTGKMLPNDLANIMYGAFDSSYNTFRNWMSRVPGGKTPAARATMKAFEWYANLTNFWKRNVLVTRPGYHTLNGWNDSLQMVVDGNLNAFAWLKRANGFLRKAEGKPRSGTLKTPYRTYTADEVIALAEKYNLPVMDATGLARLEQVGPAAAQYKRFQRATQRELRKAEKVVRKRGGKLKGDDFEAAVAKQLEGQAPMTKAQRKALRKETLLREPLEFTKDYTGIAGGLPAKTGEWIAKQWEAHAKLGHFMWRLSKGDSPSIAAKRTFDVLLDYADPGRGVQVARWLFPFATWMMTAPKMTARLAATRPGAVSAVHRFFEMQQPEEGGAEPGSYISMRAPHYQLGRAGKDILGAARETIRKGIAPLTGEDPSKIPGTGVGPGMSALHMPREPFGESWTMPLETLGLSSLMQGRGLKWRPEPLIGSMAPAPKFLAEQLHKKEALTGKALAAAEPLGMFPSKMPAVPEFLRTSPQPMKGGQRVEETPWLTRYLMPMLMSPAGIQLANMYLYGRGGGEEGAAPISTIGRYRQYTPPGEAGNLYAQQILNMFTGAPAYTVSPMDMPYERSRELRNIQGAIRQALMDADKMRRARQR